MAFVLLTRCSHRIERDALLARLHAEGFETQSPERDQVTQYGSEPNLRLEGYSALFEGYEIRVRQEELSRAQEVLASFRQDLQVLQAQPDLLEPGSDSESSESPTSPEEQAFRRFLAAALWALILPVVMNLVSLYWLSRSGSVIKNKKSLLAIGVLLHLLALASGGFLIFSLIPQS